MDGQITVQGNENVITPITAPQKGGTFRSFGKLIREFISIGVWLYVPIKLFVFDIDLFLVKRFLPDYVPLLSLKFFVWIGVMALFLSFTKNMTVLIWILYVVFYPAVFLFWRIPSFIIRQNSWVLGVAYINALVSFYKSFKYAFVSASVFLISLATILCSSKPIFLWSSILAILVLLTISFFHTFLLVFKPSNVYQLYTKAFSGVRKIGTTSFALDENMKNLPLDRLDQQQIQKWTANLQLFVLFNRVCLFAAKKLRDYQNSGLNIVSNLLVLFQLIVFTILSFACINFGLFEINRELFNFKIAPTFFTFFYDSFNSLLFRSAQGALPAMPISQAIWMVESFLSFVLGGILVSLLLSVKSQRHSDELNKVVGEIEKEGKSMESFIREEYKINTIDDAIAELQRLKANFINIIFTLSKNID